MHECVPRTQRRYFLRDVQVTHDSGSNRRRRKVHRHAFGVCMVVGQMLARELLCTRFECHPDLLDENASLSHLKRTYIHIAYNSELLGSLGAFVTVRMIESSEGTRTARFVRSGRQPTAGAPNPPEVDGVLPLVKLVVFREKISQVYLPTVACPGTNMASKASPSLYSNNSSDMPGDDDSANPTNDQSTNKTKKMKASPHVCSARRGPDNRETEKNRNDRKTLNM